MLDALIDAYQGELRRPASTYFVIDISGSMQGEGITQLRAALLALAGDDASLSGRFARFQPRERVYMLPFSGSPGDAAAFRVARGTRTGDARAGWRADLARQLRADGGTAIFSSVRVALRQANADRKQAPDRAYSVVIMTDGRNESGIGEQEFASWYSALPETDRGIPVFGLLFGNAEKSQLDRIAQLTGGRVFDARKNLSVAFKEIRGYQ